MPINLQKGSAPQQLRNAQGGNLSQIYIGLGWDMAPNCKVDLDASVACLGANDKLAGSEWFIFYNNLTSPDRRAVCHSGDNRTGQGEGDDESIKIDLNAVPPNITKLLLVISMHDANGMNFTSVRGAFFRIVDMNTNQETHRLDLSSGQGGTTECLIFAEIIRTPQGWNISPVCYSIPTLSALLGNLQ
eukprot:CAMPEP_0206195106 /NCGR_PEP_ID=MMETSP0166-20121206/7623_1 /ASSEMBLY_ACC=CAM_ASM_000260 /TAXON_ID=95228 /ORGANISM="Vannella robusta, Strain DIVA3 518/3/11/1/6" /LENGTH=187 /DNA_ID=CAMNT_0053612263 /DNA_START=28 /DNA_END=591 /DNA_ORIENTATION=-